MVLLFRYGTFRMPFTGDLGGGGGKKAGRDIAGSAAGRRTGRSGNHGSKNGSSDVFLAQVRPRVSVISCGAENRYGHPAPETIIRLEAIGSEIHTTAATGAIQITTDGRRYTITDYCAK